MEDTFKIIFDEIEEKKQIVLDAERHIWKHPESGYKEWKTHAYLKERYEELGYTLHEMGDIPGFYTDVDTGREGPTVAIFGELDSLVIPEHPECDKETGAVHACGHNCQSAGLLGVAIGLKAPHALDALCGRIRLIAVPAEELIETDFRYDLKKKGIIHYLCGKPEFIYRGVLDGVDMAMMLHAGGGDKLTCPKGSNGFMLKTAEFIGKSAHAGGSPQNGINALYAANTAMTAANALRETFVDNEHIRFHPIISEGGTSINAIPNRVKLESYLRGSTVEAIKTNSVKINRAFAGAAVAMGCKLILKDAHGAAPRYNDTNFLDVLTEAGKMLLPEDRVVMSDGFATGCSDMGDVSSLMPAIHPHIGGVIGNGHGTNYFIKDPYLTCVVGAKVLAATAALLLINGAEKAKNVIANKKIVYQSKEEYLKAIDSITAEYDVVNYTSEGSAELKYSN